jgi:hypothetical protein
MEFKVWRRSGWIRPSSKACFTVNARVLSSSTGHITTTAILSEARPGGSTWSRYTNVIMPCLVSMPCLALQNCAVGSP